MKIFRGLLLLGLLSQIGCDTSKDYKQETIRLNKFLNIIGQPQINNQKEVYILATVNTGCHSCNESVLNYAKSERKVDALHFIFSSQGIKMLHVTLREKKISADEIIADGKFLVKKMNLIPNTAIAYFTSDGEVIKASDINSATVVDVFKTIKEYIDI